MPALAPARASRAVAWTSSIVVAAASLLAAPSASATKLIARYTLDETVGPTINDVVGTNTAATESGGPGQHYDGDRIPGGAYGELTIGDQDQQGTCGLDSPGTGSWATAGNNELGALTNDFTVMAWVKINSTDTGFTQRIIGRTFSGADGWSFGVADFGKLQLTRFGVVDLVSSNVAVIQGEWTHVAVAKSSGTGVTFFVNGMEIENLPTQTADWLPSTDPWNLLSLGTIERLVGLVDDVRVYQGALSAEGIRQALEVPPVNLFAHYSFGEPNGPKRFDWNGTPADATESGIASGVVYGAAPIPAGAYGSLNIAGNTFGANGGQTVTNGEWLTPGNNKLATLTRNFTVMAWVKPDSVFFRQRVIGRANAGSGGWSFGIDQGGLSGTAFMFTDYGIGDAVSVATPIVENTWQHLAVTKSDYAGFSFYLNGNFVERVEGGAESLPSSDAWSLLGSTNPMAAKVDEVRVYQGVLDTQSIRDAASGLSCRNPNLALTAGSRFDQLVLLDQDLIEDLNLTVDLSYARVGDMSVLLKHIDTGTTITAIVTPLGPGGIGTCNGRDVQVTLDDSAATFASNACNAAAVPSIKGTFKPSQALSKFKREPLAGTWRLQIDDAEGPGTGNLFRWCLQAQKASVPNRLFADSFDTP